MASQVARTVRRAGKGYLPRPRAKNPSDYGGLIRDPAIERWMYMRENTTVHFKWTPKTVGLALFWCGVIPGTMLYYIHEEIKNKAIAEGRDAAFFPFSDISNRKPDPLPPRKPGVKIEF